MDLESTLTVLAVIAFLVFIYFIPDLYAHFKLRNKVMKKNQTKINGYVYVVSNTSFKKDIVKIGMTKHKDVHKRVNELYNTSIPAPFNLEFIIPHERPEIMERYLHKLFHRKRVNHKREFFEIKTEDIKKELIRLGFN